jgi:hypothetical protein
VEFEIVQLIGELAQYSGVIVYVILSHSISLSWIENHWTTFCHITTGEKLGVIEIISG